MHDGDRRIHDGDKKTHDPERVYILGLGSIGRLVAHSLRGIPEPPPVTLISHRPMLLQEWRDSNKQIVIEKGGSRVAASGFKMELALPMKRAFGIETNDMDSIYSNPDGLSPHEAAKQLADKRSQKIDALEDAGFGGGKVSAYDMPPKKKRFSEQSNHAIHNLIVTVKAQLTVGAVLAIKHRLRRTSVIVLLQNGMGVVEELNQHVFPDPATRPNYVLGIVSHGVNVPPGSSPFFAKHAGAGTIALSAVPATDHAETDITSTVLFEPSTRYIMRTLTRTPVLAAIGLPNSEFLQQKFEKLAMNAVINCLTVMLDSRNGVLTHNFALTTTMRLLIAEISLVLRSLPELQGLPNLATRFSAKRIETLIVALATKTKDNVSSMLADVRAGRSTEVRYINGYIVKRGEELGLTCVVNYFAMQTVLGKAKVVSDEADDAILTEIPADSVGKG